MIKAYKLAVLIIHWEVDTVSPTSWERDSSRKLRKQNFNPSITRYI